ncbi:suppressor of tub2 mutation [Tulasnella sp. 418]|nr:suppressor of tub2 mutation [Tulasnella sp. 418]
MRNRTPRFAHDAHVVALGELIARFLVLYQRTQWRTVARAAAIDALQVADTSRTEVSDTTALDGDGISGTELVEPDCNEETRPSQLYGTPVEDPPVTDSFDAKVEENGDDIAAEPDVAIDSHTPVADQTFGDKETATPELLYDDDSDDEVENELLQAPGTPMAQGLPDIPPAIEDTSGEFENLYEKSLQSIGIIYLEDLCDGLKTPVSVTPTAIEDGTEDHLGEAMAYFLQLTAEQSLIDEAQDPSTSEVMETVGLEKTPNVDEEDSPSLPQDIWSDANSPLAKDAEPIALVEDDTEISGTIMPDVETVNMERSPSDEEEGAPLGEDGPVKEKTLPDILVYDEAGLQQEGHEEEAHQEEYSPFASFITGEEPQAHHAMTMGFMDDNIPEEAIEGDSYLGTGPVMGISSGEPRTAYCRIPLLVRSVQLGEIDRRRPGVPSGAQNTSVRIPGTPKAWVPEVVGFNVETCDYLEEIFAAIDCYWFDQPNGNQYWQQRKFVISWLRRAIRGYSYEGFKEALADGLAENQRARFKRTVMALQPLHQHPVLACATAALYGELAVALGNRFGEFAEEVILILLALRGSPFAVLAEEAQATVTKILKNVKAFDPQAFIPYLLDKDLTRLCTSNSVEGRRHVLAHLRTILVWHRESARIRLTSNIKLIQEVEDAIMAGLRDEDKALQSIAVDCYWAFTTTWPVRGKLLRVWLNPRIGAMLDERKELSCALDAREESSKVVPQLVVQMPAGEEFKPLETTELWEGVIPFPSRRGTGTRRRTNSNFLGPFPWITQRELETE